MMTEWIGGSPVNLTLGSITAICIILILFGGLVPYRTYKQAIIERDTWKTMALEEQAQKRMILQERSLPVTLMETVVKGEDHHGT